MDRKEHEFNHQIRIRTRIQRGVGAIIRAISMHCINVNADCASAIFLWTSDFVVDKATKGNGRTKKFVSLAVSCVDLSLLD